MNPGPPLSVERAGPLLQQRRLCPHTGPLRGKLSRSLTKKCCERQTLKPDTILEGKVLASLKFRDQKTPKTRRFACSGSESHYLSKRSRRQPSILTFLAQDAASQVFCYSNADIRKGEEAEAIFRFIKFWERQHGSLPQHLVFDSQLTNYPQLDWLDEQGISFITLRRRSAKLLAEAANLPPSAWRTLNLDVPSRKFRTPQVYEQKVRLLQRTFRQFFIKDLGHEQPTILLTNDRRATQTQLVLRYAKRMLIENALSDAVRFFHIDALSSSVGLKVDFDMALLMLASGLYRIMTQRMRGYSDAQARQIFRDLIDMQAQIIVTDRDVQVKFHRRSHLPIVLASGLFDKPVNVPWWGHRPLRLIE